MTHLLLDNSETDSTAIETSGRTIRPALEPVGTVVDETRVYVSDWGIFTYAVDPANVGVVSHAIYPNAFERYECEESFVTGLNVSYTQSALQQARLGERTDDPVALDLTDKQVVAQIEREGLTYSERWQNLDAASVRENPDLNVSDGDATCEVDPSQLVNALQYIDRHSDYAKFMVQDGSLLLESEQDVGKSVVAFDDTDVSEDKVSLYSMDYLLDFAEAIEDAKVDKLTLSWDDEYPVFMKYLRTDKEDNPMYQGEMMLAPRIQT